MCNYGQLTNGKHHFWQPCSWCFGDKSTQSFLFVLIYTSQFFGNDVLPQWLSIIHFSPNCSLVLETLVLNIVLVIQNLTSMKFLSWTMHAIIAVMLPSWIIIQNWFPFQKCFSFTIFGKCSIQTLYQLQLHFVRTFNTVLQYFKVALELFYYYKTRFE